ncbi:MAG: ribosomal protein methyltransferase [Segetibacter sp.]|nr:ribosomal protein methyltransferase [Segetibacter sp.]
MRNTVQLSIAITDDNTKDELIARLSALSFDAFEEKENELLAFIEEINFDSTAVENVLSLYKTKFSSTIIEEQNWNALWESNFDPVVVDDFCAIRADFHEPFTDKQHEIIITPKMSFGTGHHATTYMMISEMSKLNFNGKAVADFGTGTGVLAILAEKMGSSFVWAIDHDDWSIENSQENIEKNDCSKVLIQKADRFAPQQKFDLILANINKSIILANVDGLLFGLKDDGEVLLSGLLKGDEQDVVSAFRDKGCRHISTVEKNNWICLLLKYNGND